MSSLAWWGILIFIPLIFEAIEHYGQLGCAWPVEPWIIGTYVQFQVLVFIAVLRLFQQCSPKIITKTVHYSLKLILASLIVWNLIGFIIVFANRWIGNKCLNAAIFSLVLSYQLVMCISMPFLLGSLLKRKARIRLSTRQAKGLMTKYLIKAYSNPAYLRKNGPDSIPPPFRLILSKLKLLEVEEDLILHHFSRPTPKTDTLSQLECIVCIQQFQLGEPQTSVGCKHKFHHKCAIDWFNVKAFCPLCHTNVRTVLLRKVLDLDKLVLRTR